MKKIIFLLILGTQLAFSQSDSPYVVKDFGKVSIKNLHIANNGSVVIKGNAKETTVKVYIYSENLKKPLSKTEIENRLSNYTFEISLKDNELKCVAIPLKNRIANRLYFRFEVEVPKPTNVDIQSLGGSLKLSDLDGTHQLKTAGGSIQLKNLSGKVEGVTAGGSIQINDGTGHFKMSTSGGSINVSSVTGVLNVTSSGGSLKFENVSGELSGKTSGGSITAKSIEGETKLSTAGGSITFSNIKGDFTGTTSGGSIKGDISKLGNHLSLTTSAGSVRVNLPFGEGIDLDLSASKIHSKKLSAFTDELKTGRLKGKVNGGGKKVSIKTSVGSIYID